MIHIFTIAARNYLSLALTLGDSIARHHPEAQFTICVSDGLEQLDDLLPATVHSGHRLLSAHELMPREQLEDLAVKYNITEYCTAIKPIVYYMDPDTHLYQRLDPITADSPDKTLYLAPHLINCRLADDHPYPEYHGEGACILPGVRVGRYAIDGANAVVTRDVPPYSIVGGVPARTLKTLSPGKCPAAQASL